jgi:hypothetical protein
LARSRRHARTSGEARRPSHGLPLG